MERTQGKPRVGWLQVFLAPWIGVLRPSAAAACLAAAPNRRFWAAYGAHAILLAVVVVLLLLWDATVRATWIAPTTLPTSAPSTSAAAFGYAAGWTRELGSRTFTEVWHSWHADGPIGPAEITFLSILFGTGVGTAFLAWLNLPRLHRAGPAAPAFSQAFRAVATSGGLLISLTALIGALFVWVNHVERLGSSRPPFIAYLTVTAGVPGAIGFILQRIGRAVASVGDKPVELQLPRCCEGCGYDLTHQPLDARCPECGHSVAGSLSPERRPGIDWEREKRPGVRRWLVTLLEVVLAPRAFYGKLRLRTPAAAARGFAVLNYLGIGLGATAWAVVIGLQMMGWWWLAPNWEELILIALLAALSVPLACWLGHRLGGAIVISWWILRRSLPDTRWAAKVLGYETAFLWVFCMYWGLLAGSFILAGEWVGRRFGERFFYDVTGMSGEWATLWAGTGVLVLIWLWRYVVALRAIRWSNY